MGQGVHRFLDDRGASVQGQCEEGAWLIEVQGLSLRVFGAEELSSDIDIGSVALSGLFVEAPDESGPAVNSAVSELNALLVERSWALDDALKLLERLLDESGCVKENENVRGDAQNATTASVQVDDDCSDISDGSTNIEIDHDGRVVGLDPMAQPQVHEASVRPAAAREDEFEVVMERLITTFMDAAASTGAAALPGGRDAYALLLRYCRWDEVAAMQRWRDGPVKLASQAGLRPPPPPLPPTSTSDGSHHKNDRIVSWRCGICFDDFYFADSGGEPGFDLGCGHKYCTCCWRLHLEAMARGGGGGGMRLLDITCPDPSCKLLVCVNIYDRLGLHTLSKSYNRALLRSFVEEGSACVECPGCTCIILLGVARPDAGPCRQCGRRFCSKCFGEPHSPLTCAENRTWKKMLEQAKHGTITKWVTRISNFLNVDTEVTARRCPNPECGTMTQKVEGCLFLGCPRCKEMWCWNCGEWGGGPSGRPQPHHVFVCTQLPADPTWLDGHVSLKADDARLQHYQEKWNKRLHGVNPYSEHPATPAEAIGAGAGTAQVSAAFFRSRAAVVNAAAINAKAGLADTNTSAVPVSDSCSTSDASVPVAADQLETDLAAATSEARAVFLYGAAWGFFEENADRKRLFEFCEADLERLLLQLAEFEEQQRNLPSLPATRCFVSAELRSRDAERRQKILALTTALRSQAQALRSYRHVGGS